VVPVVVLMGLLLLMMLLLLVVGFGVLCHGGHMNDWNELVLMADG
jgi:hypothetical protein